MFDKLEELNKKYEYLQKQMMDPDVLKDIKLIEQYGKEIKELKPVIEKYTEYLKLEKELTEAREILQIEDDSDTKIMFEDIIQENSKNILVFEEELKILLLPQDPNDGKNAIMEIRGAAGGDEANIFAGDLYRMYSRYADLKGWKIELLEHQESESGGFTQVSFMIEGEDVYSRLKFESGAHRVQRIPKTETQGRVHTSTATVILLPEVDDIDIDIKDNDVKIDVYRSSGAGGQSVNTTDSAVRITHLETGIVVSCQTERSQLQNKEQAFKVLRARVYDYYRQKQLAENDNERKSRLGTGDRSEKIRTYNYPQNRVTDHRIGLTIKKLDQIMDGKLDEIIDPLILEDQMTKLASEKNE